MVTYGRGVSWPRVLLWSLGMTALIGFPLMMRSGQEPMLIIAAAQAVGSVGAVLAAVFVAERQGIQSMAVQQRNELALLNIKLDQEIKELEGQRTLQAEIRRMVYSTTRPSMMVFSDFKDSLGVRVEDAKMVMRYLRDAIFDLDRICSFDFHNSSTAALCMASRRMLANAHGYAELCDEVMLSQNGSELMSSLEKSMGDILDDWVNLFRDESGLQ